MGAVEESKRLLGDGNETHRSNSVQRRYVAAAKPANVERQREIFRASSKMTTSRTHGTVYAGLGSGRQWKVWKPPYKHVNGMNEELHSLNEYTN